MLVKEKEITVDEFEQFLRLPEYQGRLFELINGEIVEKIPTEETLDNCVEYWICY